MILIVIYVNVDFIILRGEKIMDNNLVYQSNDLVLATYTMTTKEKNLLLACISQIDSRPDALTISKQTKFVVTVEQMTDLFYQESNKQNVYRDLEDVSLRLKRREVAIELEDGKTLITNFVSGVLYDPKNNEVTLTFAEDILPYLTQLKKNFTKYRLIEISELASTHSIRLYELIVCWTGQFQYSKKLDIDDFRYVMGLSGKYRQFGQLRERVIDVAIAEINESTNYKVSIEYKKVGRTFVNMTLKFHKKALARLENNDGKISEDMLNAIVRSQKFEADYNNYHRLSGDGKRNTEAFRDEMKNFIVKFPEDFTKKPLENYLK